MNKFDEAMHRFEVSCEYDTPENKVFNSEQRQVAYYILKDFFEEAPTIEMTQKQADTIKYHLKFSDLATVIDIFKSNRGQVEFGIRHTNLMGKLSLEDIVRAWLDPNVIKVTEEKQ